MVFIFSAFFSLGSLRSQFWHTSHLLGAHLFIVALFVLSGNGPFRLFICIAAYISHELEAAYIRILFFFSNPTFLF